ncbi:hypothetical protein [Pedobacter sp. Leaf176]|uniref:hypothetical protein n=1 Tax=Pedobacter sp. Leaf176 TaxID=1736286 RepID=UPI0012FBEFC6|nr:hypothetical protein [Pedobacter sp. Leaf176]
MKIMVLFLALCIVVFPFMEGNAKSMQRSASDKCCHEMTKESSCTDLSKNRCNPTACQTMTICINITFLKSEVLSPASLFPIFMKKVSIPNYLGELSRYSSVSWRPPAV